MTISSTVRKAGPFVGTGLVSAYPFSFKVFVDSDVLVQQEDTSGNITDLILDSDYTVTLNADQDTSPGGTVTLTSPLTASYTMVITSTVPQLQGLDLVLGGNFDPDNIEKALDRVTVLTQQLQVLLNQAILSPYVDPNPNMELPAASVRANKFLVFNPDGSVGVTTGTGADSALRTDLANTAEGYGADLIPTAIKTRVTLAQCRALTGATTGTAVFLASPDGGLFYKTATITTASSGDGGNYAGSWWSDTLGNKWVREPFVLANALWFGLGQIADPGTAVNNALALYDTAVPAGSYTSAVKITATGTRLVGAGMSSTIWTYTGTDYIAQFYGSDPAAPAVENFTFNGNSNCAGGLNFGKVGTGLRHGVARNVLVGGCLKSGTYAFDATASINSGVYYNLFENCIAGSINSTTIAFTGGPLAGATAATLSTNWTGTTGNYAVAFSDHEVRAVTLTHNATTATWSGGLTNGVSATASVTNGNNAGFRITSTDGAVNGNRANSMGFRMCVAIWNVNDAVYIDYGVGLTFSECDFEANGGYALNFGAGTNFDVSIFGGYIEHNFLGRFNKTSDVTIRQFGGRNIDDTSGTAWGNGDIMLGENNNFGIDPSGNFIFTGTKFNMSGVDPVFMASGTNLWGADSTNFLTRFYRGQRFNSTTVSSTAGAIDLSGVRTKYIETTLTEDITAITLPPAIPGVEYVWIIHQAGGGGKTVTGFGGSVLFFGGGYTMTAGANKTDALRMTYLSSYSKFYVRADQNA